MAKIPTKSRRNWLLPFISGLAVGSFTPLQYFDHTDSVQFLPLTAKPLSVWAPPLINVVSALVALLTYLFP